MSKLTEIKQRLNDVHVCRGREFNEAVETFNTYAPSDIDYLLYLLEEKDKALEIYADKNNYLKRYAMAYGVVTRIQIPFVNEDEGNIARKALNISTDNEGDG